ncbi:type IV pilus assembly protein FimV [Chitinilyticum litopenaei]|uniref:type IV pilus assembly protein FimV n=1 Tax=Chitinilyticum litopenaei TaxID=1121276 RepID=UPI001186337F|nr:hypothetical protein [Chitinilyticum litopenaei]
MAVTLGDIRVQSALGERFAAQVPVHVAAGEEISPACFRLVRPSLLEHDGTGVLAGGSLRLLTLPDGSSQLQIRSDALIQDPLLRLAVRVRCPGNEGQAFQREYNALLDPREYAAVALDAPQVSVSARPRAGAAPRRTAPRGGTWLTREGDTVDGIARAYVSRAGAARQQFIQQLYDLNPDLPQSSTAQLSADVAIRIPPAPQVEAPSLPAPVSALPTLLPLPPALESQRPSLTLGGELASAGKASGPANYGLQLSAPVLEQGKSKLTPEEALLLRERLLALDSDDQAAQTLQLKYQVAQLQKQLAELRQRDQGLKREPQVSERPGQSWLWLALPLALVLLFPVGFVVWRRRQIRQQENSEVFTRATIAAPVTRATVRPVERGEMNTQLPEYASMSGINLSEIGVPVHRPMNEDWQSEVSSEVDVVQPNSVAEEAQLLLDHGLGAQAINLLLHEIQSYPAALALWMKLFDVYVQQGMKDAFQEQAVAFRLQFSSDSLWQQVQEKGRQLDAANPLYRSLDLARDEFEAELQGMQAPVGEQGDVFASFMRAQAGLPEAAPAVAAAPPQAEADRFALRPVLMPSEPLPLPFTLDDQVEQEVTASVPPGGDDLEFDLDFSPPPPPPVRAKFASDDPALQKIAVLLNQGADQEAIAQLEQLLYKGTLDQKLTASKWLDQIVPLPPLPH